VVSVALARQGNEVVKAVWNGFSACKQNPFSACKMHDAPSAKRRHASDSDDTRCVAAKKRAFLAAEKEVSSGQHSATPLDEPGEYSAPFQSLEVHDVDDAVMVDDSTEQFRHTSPFSAALGDADLNLDKLRAADSHAATYGTPVLVGRSISAGSAAALISATDEPALKGCKWWYEPMKQELFQTCAASMVHNTAVTKFVILANAFCETHGRGTNRLDTVSDATLNGSSNAPDVVVYVPAEDRTELPLIIVEVEYGNRDIPAIKTQVSSLFGQYPSLHVFVSMKIPRVYDLDHPEQFQTSVVSFKRGANGLPLWDVALDLGTAPLDAANKDEWARRESIFRVPCDQWTRHTPVVEGRGLQYDTRPVLVLPAFSLDVVANEAGATRAGWDALADDGAAKELVFDLISVMSSLFVKVKNDALDRQGAYNLAGKLLPATKRSTYHTQLSKGRIHPTTAVHSAVEACAKQNDGVLQFVQANPFPLQPPPSGHPQSYNESLLSTYVNLLRIAIA
jgi:hypothetical protein